MSETIVKGLKAVAAHFGKSERQVRRWAQDPTFPRLSGGRFDLIQIQAWLDARDGRTPARVARRDPQQPGLPVSSGKDFQEERLKKAKADLAEMEVRQRRGELLERSELKHLAISRIIAVKQGLKSLARSLPALLPIPPELRREAEAVITEKVMELLAEFARPFPEKFGEGAPKMTQGGA